LYAQYYHILGLEEGASKDEVKKAYYKKAKVYHPDINKNENAREQFILAQRAFDILYNENPIKRVQIKSKAYASKHSTYSRMRDEMQREAYRKKYGNSKRYHDYINQKESNNGPATAFRKKFFSEEYDIYGRLICYGFLAILIIFGGFLFFLPLFVAIFYRSRFITTSSLLSFLMGAFILRYALDWYRDLKTDFAKK